MASISVKVEPLDKDIELIFREDLSPEARKMHLAKFAREKLKEGQAINRQALGRLPTHQTFVDGTKATEDRVRPDGTILYEFQLFEDMLDWIADQLMRHSPMKSGRYAKSHELYTDGVEANTRQMAKSEWVFINTQPYARKIERGQSVQAPEGVYQAVATLAKRRFGNHAKISFGYRSPIGGNTNLEAWAGSTSQTRRGSPVSVEHWNRRQPAIIITPR